MITLRTDLKRLTADDLVTELAKKLLIAYKEQIYDDGVGCGPSYMSSLVWNAWRGLPLNPDDPIPYIETILPHETQKQVALREDTRISELDRNAQEALYVKCAEKMWEFIQAETDDEQTRKEGADTCP